MSFPSRKKKMRTKKWEIIDLPAIDVLELLSEEELASMSLSAAFCIRFFRHDMHYLYTVASNYVKLTRGVLDYLQDYNQLGPNKSRNKLFICIQYDRNKECPNGSLCREVHCTIPLDTVEDAAFYNVPSNATGAPSIVKVVPGREILEKKLNRPFSNVQTSDSVGVTPGPVTVSDELETTPLDTLAASGSLVDVNGHLDSVVYLPSDTILRHSLHSRWTSRKMYRTFSRGVLFKVALPNTPTPVDTYDSSELFITKGALEYYEQCIRKEATTVTMQHCAHYSKNGICCFGEDCQFVHVLHYNSCDRVENGGNFNLDADVGSAASSEKKTRGKKFTNPKVEPLTVNQVNKCFQNTDALSSSHPSSSTQSTSSFSRGSRVAPLAASQPVNNLVFVPPSMMWVPLDTTSTSLFSNQQAPLVVQPPMWPTLPPQPTNNMYMVASGPSGESYIVQQSQSLVPTPVQHMGGGGNLHQGSQQQQQQQMYMVPMRYSS